MSLISQKAKKKMCLEPWCHLVLTCRGSVRRCCSDMFDCPEGEELGNAFERPLEELLFSPRRLALQQALARGDYEGLYLCNRCHIPS